MPGWICSSSYTQRPATSASGSVPIATLNNGRPFSTRATALHTDPPVLKRYNEQPTIQPPSQASPNKVGLLFETNRRERSRTQLARTAWSLRKAHLLKRPGQGSILSGTRGQRASVILGDRSGPDTAQRKARHRRGGVVRFMVEGNGIEPLTGPGPESAGGTNRPPQEEAGDATRTGAAPVSSRYATPNNRRAHKRNRLCLQGVTVDSWWRSCENTHEATQL